MTTKNSKDIKKIYSDALYWAMAPKSKGKPYHLGRVDESILRKLIHYDKTNSQIKYSSEWIAKHTFLDITQIEKTIPRLEKKRYIKTITHGLKDDSGNKIKRRTIYINWKFIESVLNEVPKIEFTEHTDKILEQSIQSVDMMPTTDIVESSDETTTSTIEMDSNNSENLDADLPFDAKKYLTPRKLSFVQNFSKVEIELEDLYFLDKQTLDDFFYTEGVWEIKTIEEDKEDLWENIHGINLYYSGSGTRLTLSILDNADKKIESYQLNTTDFKNYLKTKKIKFKDLTYDNFETLRQFEKEPLNL
jgi:hypothetical protein